MKWRWLAYRTTSIHQELKQPHLTRFTSVLPWIKQGYHAYFLSGIQWDKNFPWRRCHFTCISRDLPSERKYFPPGHRRNKWENSYLVLLHLRLALMGSHYRSCKHPLTHPLSVRLPAQRRKGVSKTEDNFGGPLNFWCLLASLLWNGQTGWGERGNPLNAWSLASHLISIH